MEHAEHPTPTLDHDRRDDPGYEIRDTNVRSVTIFGVMLVALIIVVNLSLLGMYHWLLRYKEPEERPLNEENLATQMRSLRQHETDSLSSYGWIDRKGGIVRIPIERAIDLAAERGVPHGKGPQTEIQVISREKNENP